MGCQRYKSIRLENSTRRRRRRRTARLTSRSLLPPPSRPRKDGMEEREASEGKAEWKKRQRRETESERGMKGAEGFWKGPLMNSFPLPRGRSPSLSSPLKSGPQVRFRISEIVAVGGGTRWNETSIYIALTNQPSRRFK